MTTETDPYLEAVYEISESGCSDPECAGCLSYAAYLRERFVTREEYEEAQETVRRVQASARTLTATQAEIYERYHKATGINTEAVATLDSEREANAILTAEVAALTAERDRLRGALEPFAAMAAAYDPDDGDDGLWAYDARPTIGHLRKARQALNQEPTNG